MRNVQELEQFWNWLPVFRAVAESESLTVAARRLDMSPSALSRTLRLLEGALGRELFVRSERSLRPNQHGEALLLAVRQGMRLIHESVRQLQSPEPYGPLRLACTGLYSHRMPILLGALQAAHPDIQPELGWTPPDEITTKLLRGDLDLAFEIDPTPNEEIEIDVIEVLSFGVYCGTEHPLYRATSVDVGRVLTYPFVGPPSSTAGSDQWPAHRARSIGLRVHQVWQAVESCAQSRFLAFLPDSAAEHLSRGPLRRLPFDEVVERTVHLVRRADVSDHHLARVASELFRRHVNSA